MKIAAALATVGMAACALAAPVHASTFDMCPDGHEGYFGNGAVVTSYNCYTRTGAEVVVR